MEEEEGGRQAVLRQRRLRPFDRARAGLLERPLGRRLDGRSAPAAQAPAAARRHTVVSGDSLSKIAKHHYGDANAWRRIYEANRHTIGDNPDLIKPGQDLVIPEEGA